MAPARRQLALNDSLPPAEPPRPLLRGPSLRVVAPNLITVLALCLGITAIRLAYEGRLEAAVAAIMAAALLDALDGRVARLLKGDSRFGVEFDSLADLVNFGVAPALLLYQCVLAESKGLGWTVCLLFAVASGLRLARFNVMAEAPSRPEWKKAFFVGTPAPAGALLALLPVYLDLMGIPIGPNATPAVLAYVVGIALLMVSNVPTLSGKQIEIHLPPYAGPLLALAVCTALVGLWLAPFVMLTAASILYLTSLPLGVAHYRRLTRSNAARVPS